MLVSQSALTVDLVEWSVHFQPLVDFQYLFGCIGLADVFRAYLPASKRFARPMFLKRRSQF